MVQQAQVAVPANSGKKNDIDVKGMLTAMLERGKLSAADTRAVNKEIEDFSQLHSKFMDGQGQNPIEWGQIGKVPDNAILLHESLSLPPKDQIRTMLNKLVVVKL